MSENDPIQQAVDTYWLKRWQVLDQSISDLRVRLVQGDDETREEADFAARSAGVFDALLGKLQSFLRKQFFFFYNGFGGGEGAEQAGLARSDARTPDFVFRQIIDQAAYDLTVIRLAVAQMALGSPAELKTLAVAANIVKGYLGSLRWEDGSDAFLPRSAQVITYFQRGAAIRVLPYCDVVLIGIPPSAVEHEEGRDLLSLGHELGHYVYWNGFQFHNVPGANKGERLSTACDFITSSRPAYIRRWQEEIFADVFGAVVTGNHAVHYAAQEMIRDNATHARVEDDGEHAIDAIRYVSYLAVLEFLNELDGFELRVAGNMARSLHREGKLRATVREAGGVPFEFPANADDDWPEDLVLSQLRFDLAGLVADGFYAQFDYFVTLDSLGNRREVPLDEAAGVLTETAKDMCRFLWDNAPEMFAAWSDQFIDSGSEIVRLMTDLEAYSQTAFNRVSRHGSSKNRPLGPAVASQGTQFDSRFRPHCTALQKRYSEVGEQKPLKLAALSKAPAAVAAAVAQENATAAVSPIEDDSSGRWFGWVRDSYDQQAQRAVMPAEAWQVVLSADGWADTDDRGGDTDAPRGVFER